MVMFRKQWAIGLVAGVTVLAGTAPRAAAQFYPGYYPYAQTPANGYLTGGASVIQSQAQFMIAKQQQALMQEQVSQAKLDTKRKALDEWLYERSKLPTPEQERELRAQQEVERSLHNPPITEITSAYALNVLLQHLQQSAGIQGPQIPLSEDLLRQINVTSGTGDGNIGLLKNSGHLTWPLGLQILNPSAETAKLREHIDTLIQQARSQATFGPVDVGVLVALNKDIDRLMQILTQNVAELEPMQYIDGKRYLRDLADGVKVLQQPNAKNYLNGTYSAKGKSVQELLDYMTKNGLQFAPAVPTESGAYVALHNAMVQYDMGVAPNAFKTAQGPARPGQ